MSVTVTLTFASLAEAIATLGRNVDSGPLTGAAGSAQPAAQPATQPATQPDKAEKAAPKPGKSAKTEDAAASPPTAAQTPAAAPAPSPASTAPTEGELPYPPLAERITKAIAASNPNSTTNRGELKRLFGELASVYGTPVKTGQDVKPADRPKLAALLDTLEKAATTEEGMS